MLEVFVILQHAIIIGSGATLVMDFWGWVQKRIFHAPPLNYGLVARWLSQFPQGKLRHDSIMTVPAINGEQVWGWLVHYAIGIAVACLLILLWGLEWVYNPTLGPAMVVGMGSALFPLFIMQPAFGIGVAGSRTPKPAITRLKTLAAHFSYAIGLFLAAKAWALL